MILDHDRYRLCWIDRRGSATAKGVHRALPGPPDSIFGLSLVGLDFAPLAGVAMICEVGGPWRDMQQAECALARRFLDCLAFVGAAA